MEQNKNYYVYHLIDPQDNKVFYVGKGIHSRAISHEICANELFGKDDDAPKKIQTINEIKALGLEIIYKIYPNMTQEEAFNVESKDIKVFRELFPDKMTNIQSGHHCDWLMTSEEIDDILLSKDKDDSIFNKYVNDGVKILAFVNNKSWDYNDSYIERYKKFQKVWRLDKNSKRFENYDLIIVVHNNIIKYVYDNVIFERIDNATDHGYCFHGAPINHELTNTYCQIRFSDIGTKYINF